MQQSPIELLTELGIETMIGDARKMTLPDSSVDLFMSNNTLEHIPADVLQAIFIEFRRLASTRSVMSHFIDMMDHYAHFDRSLTPYNFLRFSERTWKLINNTVKILNRLRIGDYCTLHQVTHFKVVLEEHEVGSAEMLATVPIAKEFQHHPVEELLITHCWMVSTPE